MPTPYLVPLTPGTPQNLTISLAGVTYQLQLRWCPPAACWIMGIYDQDGDPIATGIPLVTGSPLLEQFQYLGIGGTMVVQTTNDLYAVPTFDNLGDTGNLYFIVP